MFYIRIQFNSISHCVKLKTNEKLSLRTIPSTYLIVYFTKITIDNLVLTLMIFPTYLLFNFSYYVDTN